MQVIDLPAITITLRHDDVAHAHFKDGHTGTVEDVKSMFEAILQARGGRKALLMVSVGVNAALNNEARAFASSPESNHYTAADAIVVRDFGHQLSANAFVRHNKPMRPIQLFPDQESALAWLATQHHLIEKE